MEYLSDVQTLKTYIEETENSDVDLKSSVGLSLLHYAIFYRKIDCMKYLIAMGANLNIVDNSGNTILHQAVKQEDIEIVKYLIECDIPLDLKNRHGLTILHLAVKANNEVLVQTILNRFNCTNSVGINIRDEVSATPIFYCKNFAIFGKLLQCGANINYRDEQGRTVLMINIHRLAQSSDPTYRDIIRLLLTSKDLNLNLDINLTDYNCRTTLHHAIICGQFEIVNEILENSDHLKPNLRIRDKSTGPYHYKLKGENCLDLAKRLYKQQCENIQDKEKEKDNKKENNNLYKILQLLEKTMEIEDQTDQLDNNCNCNYNSSIPKVLPSI